jgi:hypothetical protein
MEWGTPGPRLPPFFSFRGSRLSVSVLREEESLEKPLIERSASAGRAFDRRC